MEFEHTTEQPTLKTILGYDPATGKEYGIINEYEAYIHRRAYDYLMVGLVTDVDQVEEQRESRFDTHVNRIGLDLSFYHTDLLEWNQKHADNANPALWQMQPGENGRMVRRTDLPSVEACREAIIPNPFLTRTVTRKDLENIAHEGINQHFDRALNDAHNLLTVQLHDIAAELPTAPSEPIEPGVRTRGELIQEYQKIISRMNAIEGLMIERNPPMDAVDNISPLLPNYSAEISPTTAKIYVVRHLGKIGSDLVRTA